MSKLTRAQELQIITTLRILADDAKSVVANVESLQKILNWSVLEDPVSLLANVKKASDQLHEVEQFTLKMAVDAVHGDL